MQRKTIWKRKKLMGKNLSGVLIFGNAVFQMHLILTISPKEYINLFQAGDQSQVNHRDHRYCQPYQEEMTSSSQSFILGGFMRCVLRNGMEANGMGWGRPEWNRKNGTEQKCIYWQYGYCSKKHVLVVYDTCTGNYAKQFLFCGLWSKSLTSHCLSSFEHLRAAISIGHQKENRILKTTQELKTRNKPKKLKSNQEYSDSRPMEHEKRQEQQ